MCDNPKTLKDLCIDCVCYNIEHFYKVKQNICTCLNGMPSREAEFINNNVYLPMELSEILMTKLSICNKLNDDVMSLFSNKNVYMRNVILPNSQKLYKNGLRILKTHKIEKLFIYDLNCSVNILIDSLSEWTIQNLYSLCIANSSIFTSSNNKIFDANVLFSKLKNLHILDVSNTEFNTNNLNAVAKDLSKLESLNISHTNVTTFLPLKMMKNHLRKLSAYNLKVPYNCIHKNGISILKYMTSLTHLDLSSNNFDSPWIQHLSDPNWLPNLVALDLSGNGNFGLKFWEEFLTHHKKLKFLGLMHTTDCGLIMFTVPTHLFYNPDLVVSGLMTQEQIFTSLKLYSLRPTYIQRCLYHLIKWIKLYNSPKVDIIQITLNAMKLYPKRSSVQTAATTCLYHLTKHDICLKIHDNVLAKVMEAILNASENFPEHMLIQKNILMIICNDRILRDIKMDKFRCVKSVLDALNCFDEDFIILICCAICSVLVAKLTSYETTRLGSKKSYIWKLLSIVRLKLNNQIVDETIKLALCTLWNFTDESFVSCKVFIDGGGIELYMRILSIFIDDTNIETRVLGLLNNIAEISMFRIKLFHVNIIPTIRRLLQSKDIDVSYFAAGIISHLSSEPYWEQYNVIDKTEILEELRYVVNHWVHPEKAMVAYKSFQPFINLLYSTDRPQVQLWAAWAIFHVCTNNAKTYYAIFKRENMENILQTIVLDKSVDSEVCERYSHILLIMKKFENGSNPVLPL